MPTVDDLKQRDELSSARPIYGVIFEVAHRPRASSPRGARRARFLERSGWPRVLSGVAAWSGSEMIASLKKRSATSRAVEWVEAGEPADAEPDRWMAEQEVQAGETKKMLGGEHDRGTRS